MIDNATEYKFVDNPSDYRFVTGITNSEVLINGEIMPVRDVMLYNNPDLTGTAHPKCLRGEDVTFLAEAINERRAAITNNTNISTTYNKVPSNTQLNNIINPLHDYIIDDYFIADCQNFENQCNPFYVKDGFTFELSGGEYANDYEYESYDYMVRYFSTFNWYKNFWTKPSDVYTTKDFFQLNSFYGNDIRGCFNDVNKTRKFYNGKPLFITASDKYIINHSVEHIKFGSSPNENEISFPTLLYNWLWVSHCRTDFKDYNNLCRKATKAVNCTLTIDMNEIVPPNIISDKVLCLLRFNNNFTIGQYYGSGSNLGPENGARKIAYCVYPYEATIANDGTITIPPDVFSNAMDLVLYTYVSNPAYLPTHTNWLYFASLQYVMLQTINFIFSPSEKTDFSNINWNWTP